MTFRRRRLFKAGVLNEAGDVVKPIITATGSGTIAENTSTQTDTGITYTLTNSNTTITPNASWFIVEDSRFEVVDNTHSGFKLVLKADQLTDHEGEGTITFDVYVRDSDGQESDREATTITVTNVKEQIRATSEPIPDLVGTVGTQISPIILEDYFEVIDDGETIGSLTLTPSLPRGLNFRARDGRINGTPSEAYSRTQHTVTAESSAGDTASRTFFVEISAAE